MRFSLPILAALAANYATEDQSMAQRTAAGRPAVKIQARVTDESITCTSVVESLVAGEPTAGTNLGWQLFKATALGASCTITLPSSVTAEYISSSSARSAWWNSMPGIASGIHDVCGYESLELHIMPIWQVCDGPQTVFVLESPGQSTVLPKMEGPSVIYFTATATAPTTGSLSGAALSGGQASPGSSTTSSSSSTSTNTGSQMTSPVLTSSSSHAGASSTSSPSATGAPSTASINSSMFRVTIAICASSMFVLSL